MYLEEQFIKQSIDGKGNRIEPVPSVEKTAMVGQSICTKCIDFSIFVVSTPE
jgi:hypothetical protein